MSNVTTFFRSAPSAVNSERGVSLIEILVALFTLSIGLLGLAAMQAKTLQFNQSAYLRTQATILANDIIDRMRANESQLSAYEIALTAATPASVDCETATCTPASMAQSDLAQWRTRISNELPEGDGSIAEKAGSPDVFDITVQWLDRDGDARSFVMEAQL